MKNKIPESEIKIDTESTCFHINQTDNRTPVLHLPSVGDVNTKMTIVQIGHPTDDVSEDMSYGYQSKWKIRYEVEQIYDEHTASMPMPGYPDCKVFFHEGLINRVAGDITFSLDTNDSRYNKDNDTFLADSTIMPHPNGNIVIPQIDITGCPANITKELWVQPPLPKMTMKASNRGHIFDMTPDGASITLDPVEGSEMQTMEPVILKIKKITQNF